MNEKVIGVWQYLIQATEKTIKDLPEKIFHVDELKVCDEAKWLIGFWLNKGCVAPMKSPSRWMRDGIRPNSMWGPAIKERLVKQLPIIKSWRAEVKDYREIDTSFEATWFIDPPYIQQGSHYIHSQINYPVLAEWAKKLKGQVIVCEADGADWLDFRPFVTAKGLEGKHGKKKIKEVIWTNF